MQLDLLQGLTNDKATGMDGLSGESLKFADPILALLLSICFTCMFKHSYLPVSMLDSVVVPLVNKMYARRTCSFSVTGMRSSSSARINKFVFRTEKIV